MEDGSGKSLGSHGFSNLRLPPALSYGSTFLRPTATCLPLPTCGCLPLNPRAQTAQASPCGLQLVPGPQPAQCWDNGFSSLQWSQLKRQTMAHYLPPTPRQPLQGTGRGLSGSSSASGCCRRLRKGQARGKGRPCLVPPEALHTEYQALLSLRACFQVLALGRQPCQRAALLRTVWLPAIWGLQSQARLPRKVRALWPKKPRTNPAPVPSSSESPELGLRTTQGPGWQV